MASNADSKRSNGKANGTVDIATGLEVEQGDPDASVASGADDAALTATAALEKLKAERDSLVDRLARLQAEFENARKRTQRELQEFKEYSNSDAIKVLLKPAARMAAE